MPKFFFATTNPILSGCRAWEQDVTTHKFRIAQVKQGHVLADGPVFTGVVGVFRKFLNVEGGAEVMDLGRRLEARLQAPAYKEEL